MQLIIAITLLLLFLAVNYINIEFVKGDSMLTTLKNEDIVLILKDNNPKTSEIIVFEMKTLNEVFIKRVVAKPNDTLLIKDGTVLVNNEPISTMGVGKTYPGLQIKEADQFVAKNKCFLVLGDNREHSMDSRDFGCVQNDTIKGKVVAVIWPPHRVKLI